MNVRHTRACPIVRPIIPHNIARNTVGIIPLVDTAAAPLLIASHVGRQDRLEFEGLSLSFGLSSSLIPAGVSAFTNGLSVRDQGGKPLSRKSNTRLRQRGRQRVLQKQLQRRRP